MLTYVFVAVFAVASAQHQEAPCANAGGMCSIGCTGGVTVAGLCPTQPANVLCCVKGSCPLVTMTPSYFTGSAARVHNTFVAAINRINEYARVAGVKVYVTSSYRKDANVGGAIVPPATKSNHMTGHAIDMNVEYGVGLLCNSACLAGRPPTQVANFIQSIRNDAGLRYGGDFSTPDVVHIDDGLNLSNPSEWDRQYVETQRFCPQ